MAGKLIIDTIQTEASFLQLNVSNTRIATMNSSGIYSNTGGKIIGSDGTFGNSTIVNATVSANLNFDTTGTSGIRLPAANTLAFHTTGAEAMRITSGQNVGIGTTNPVAGTGFTADRKLLQIVPSSGTANAQVHLGGVSGTILDHDDSNNTITTLRNLYGASSASAAMQLQSGYMTFGTGTSYTERMRIDASGRVTMPAQPAFYAVRNAGNVASSTVVIFNNVLTNIGGHYNSSNGRFTAPIAGTYRLCVRLLLGTTGFAVAAIRKNGETVGLGQAASASVSNGATGQAEAILILAAGDYIDTLNPSGDVYGSDTFTAFSGQLIG